MCTSVKAISKTKNKTNVTEFETGGSLVAPAERCKKVDHQEISACMSLEMGQDEQDFENEHKLFNKHAMKIRPGLTQAVTNESFPSNDCNCFFV